MNKLNIREKVVLLSFIILTIFLFSLSFVNATIYITSGGVYTNSSVEYIINTSNISSKIVFDNINDVNISCSDMNPIIFDLEDVIGFQNSLSNINFYNCNIQSNYSSITFFPTNMDNISVHDIIISSNYYSLFFFGSIDWNNIELYNINSSIIPKIHTFFIYNTGIINNFSIYDSIINDVSSNIGIFPINENISTFNINNIGCLESWYQAQSSCDDLNVSANPQIRPITDNYEINYGRGIILYQQKIYADLNNCETNILLPIDNGSIMQCDIAGGLEYFNDSGTLYRGSPYYYTTENVSIISYLGQDNSVLPPYLNIDYFYSYTYDTNNFPYCDLYYNNSIVSTSHVDSSWSNSWNNYVTVFPNYQNFTVNIRCVNNIATLNILDIPFIYQNYYIDNGNAFLIKNVDTQPIIMTIITLMIISILISLLFGFFSDTLGMDSEQVWKIVVIIVVTCIIILIIAFLNATL
jgi:hypothetical protein